MISGAWTAAPAGCRARRAALAVLVAWLLAAAAMSAPPAALRFRTIPEPPDKPNLLGNPGYEDAKAESGGARMAAGWSVRVSSRMPGWGQPVRMWPGQGVPEVQCQARAARSGRQGLAMRLSAAEPRLVAQQRVDLNGVTAASSFVLAVWTRSAGSDTLRAHLDIYGDKYGPAAMSRMVFVTGEWSRVAMHFSLQDLLPKPDKDGKAVIWVRLTGWGTEGEIHWDDAVLAPVQETWEEYNPEKPLPADAAWEDGLRRMARPSPTVAGEVRIEPSTLHAIGVEWPIQGDYNRNGRVTMQFREAGTTAWQDALPLHRMMHEWSTPVLRNDDVICPNMYAGSALNLKPATEYEIRLALTDPDGGDAERIVKAATKRMPEEPADGRELHVYPQEWTGPKAKPFFATLVEAHTAARPGDKVILHEGTHRAPPDTAAEGRRVAVHRLTRSGEPGRPIIIRGAGKAVIEGTDSANYLVYLDGVSHTWIEGLSFGDAKYSVIYGGQCRGVVIRGCVIETRRHGIRLTNAEGSGEETGGAMDCTVSDNTLVGPLSEVWRTRGEWLGHRGGYSAAFKTVGIQLSGAGGNDVCHNLVDGFFDGINVSHPEFSPSGKRPSGSTDIYNNYLRHSMDDGSQLDATRHNARFHHNVIDGGMMAVSTQGIYGGPAYIYRNICYRITFAPVKTEQNPTGLYVFNNTFICERAAQRLMPYWQNSTFANNLFLGDESSAAKTRPREARWGPLFTGTMGARSNSLMDHNGYNALETGKRLGWQEMPGGSIWWRDVDRRWFDSTQAFTAYTGYEQHAVWGLSFRDFATPPAWSPDVSSRGFDRLDFRLRPDSAAVDAGMSIPQITDGFRGKAPDLGAIECGELFPQVGPRPR